MLLLRLPGEMGIIKRTAFLCLSCLLIIITSTAAQSFKCSSVRSCDAIIDYVSPNTTTISAINSLFNVSNLRSFLGANNFPLSTLASQPVTAKQTIKIPIPCICTNGTGKSNKLPIYTVVQDDGLYHIAAEVFSGLVTYQEIQDANNITDANKIDAGQKLWIPLPCSCDDVQGQRVVHYAHVVSAGSTVDGIAKQYNTSEDVLLRLNGLASPNDLKAGAVLDVPLKACTSTISNNSLDYPLLVPNGTYVFTAADCVKCKCDAANNWTLQCEPSQLKSSLWASCPSMQCQGAEKLSLGNSTSSSCNSTTCSYSGYTNQTIITSISLESTCPASSPGNNASAVSLHGWRWNFIVIAFHLMLLCIHFH